MFSRCKRFSGMSASSIANTSASDKGITFLRELVFIGLNPRYGVRSSIPSSTALFSTYLKHLWYGQLMHMIG